jgi:hypothetical protein
VELNCLLRVEPVFGLHSGRPVEEVDHKAGCITPDAQCWMLSLVSTLWRMADKSFRHVLAAKELAAQENRYDLKQTSFEFYPLRVSFR